MGIGQDISRWIKQKAAAAKAEGCILGLSGGIDSAVTALLCREAFPETTLGLILPCCSLKSDIKTAKDFAKNFNIATKTIDLTPIFEDLYKILEGKAYRGQKDLAAANLKPRLRMISLYYHANKMNYLVVGTGNKSELKMGYFTKWGDGGVDLLPLGDLLKTDVRKLAQELSVPKRIIDKPPSAGLWEGQTDEGEMGITYPELDAIISGKSQGISREKVLMVAEREKATSHKCRMPEIFFLK